jgi:hypothetical protein
MGSRKPVPLFLKLGVVFVTALVVVALYLARK